MANTKNGDRELEEPRSDSRLSKREDEKDSIKKKRKSRKQEKSRPDSNLERRHESILSNLNALEAKLEDPNELAKHQKQRSKNHQRQVEAKKNKRLILAEKKNNRPSDEDKKLNPNATEEDGIKSSDQLRKQTRLENQNLVQQVKQKLSSSDHKTSNLTWHIQPQSLWYDTSYLPVLLTPTQPTDQRVSEDSIELLKSRADFILRTISEQFTDSIQPKSKQSGDSIVNRQNTKIIFDSSHTGLSESDKAFIHRILTSGTSSDKLSALTLLISSTPLHSRHHLTTLLNLSKKKNREGSGRTIRALIDWLRGGGNLEIGGLPNRKLKYFRDQPGLATIAKLHGLEHGPSSKFKYDNPTRLEHDEWLGLWAFEDWLKNWYLDLLRTIEGLSNDPIVFTRSQSLSCIFHLLKDKPEQEQNLLSLLVNKLGDGDKMICSRSSHYLLQLLQVHPLMKPIFVREISALILKPIILRSKADPTSRGMSDPSLRHHDHARYYGTITLNQITLSKLDKEVSNKLIQLYFELFNDILGKAKTEEQDKELREIVEKNEEDLEAENLEEQAKLKRPKSRKQAKGKAGKSNQAVPDEEAAAERKSRLLAAILTGLNRAFPYASVENEVFRGYMDTLFRIIHTGAFSVSIQALILVQHLLKSKPEMAARFYRVLYGTLIDHRLLTATSKHALYLNLLFKSVNADSNQSRVMAFVRRIVQILPYYQPPFICSTIVLLAHLFSTKTYCAQLLLPRPASSTFTTAKKESEETSHQDQYDGRKRDPTYANADQSSLWELVPLLSHYHPAVSLNANQLLCGDPVTSSVDLNHHTLSSFLDKFVYRQPKKTVAQKGSSIMQPDLHYRLGDVVKRQPNRQTDQPIPLNSKAFLDRAEDDVPVEELFFHKYFKAKSTEEEIKKKKRKDRSKTKSSLPEDRDFGGRGGSDDGSEGEEEVDDDLERNGEDREETDEEEEEEVWEAMKSTMGKNLKDALPDDDEDDWSELDQAAFEDSEEDGDLKDLLKGEDDDVLQENEDEDEEEEEEEEESEEDLQESVEFENEEISVSDLEESDRDKNSDEEIDEGVQPKRLKRKSSHSQRPGSKEDPKPHSKKRKTWKSLPTFASADDYLHLLSDGDES